MENKYFEDEVFQNLKLEDEIFEGYEFIDCEFHNCVITESKFINCYFSNCQFFNCNMMLLTTEHTEVKFGEFIKCIMVGINWDLLLPSGRFAEPIRKLENCTLRYNHFSEMAFNKFDFSGSDFSNSTFEECTMKECNFENSRLENTEYYNCDLRKADFRDATGYQIDILSCKLKGAKFSFPEAIQLLKVLEIKVE